MEQLTAAAVISFSERLQEVSARFYQDLAAAYPPHRAAAADYATRCERDKTQIVRTYRETVTDALETGYSFAGLTLPAGLLEASVPAGDWEAARERAAALEEGAAAFYEEVATRSAALLATIPRAFRRVAERRARQAEVWRTQA